MERWRVNFEPLSVQVGKSGAGLAGRGTQVQHKHVNIPIYFGVCQQDTIKIFLSLWRSVPKSPRRVPRNHNVSLCWLCPTASQVPRIWWTSLSCCYFNPNLAWSRWKLPWELACPVAEPPSSVHLAQPPQPSAFGSLVSLVSTAHPLIHPCSISA